MPLPRATQGHRRAVWKCNTPCFLYCVILTYWILTFFVIGDGAIRGRNPEARVTTSSWKPSRVSSLAAVSAGNRRLNQLGQAINNSPLKEIRLQEAAAATSSPSSDRSSERLVGNAIADVLLLICSNCTPLKLLHAVPDMVFALAIGGLTVWALAIAALCDPGELTATWGDEARERFRLEHAAAATATIIDMSSPSISSPSNVAATTVASVNNNNNNNNNGTGLADDEGMGSPVASPATLGTAPPPPLTEPPACPGMTYCDSCHLWRPSNRWHHDRVTQKCFLRGDHFCGFVDNYVAFRTHKCFFLFIAHILTAIYHFLFMLIRFFFAESVIEWMNSRLSILPMLVLFMYAMMVVCLGALALGFFWSVLIGMMGDETTLEAQIRRTPRYHGGGVKRPRQPPLTDSDDEGKPPGERKSKHCLKWCLWLKPRRWYKNLCTYLGNNPLLWLIPQHMPMPPTPMEAIRTRDQ